MNCLILFLFVTLSCLSGNVKAECKDNSGRIVRDGMHFTTSPDSCITCICDKNEAKLCKPIICYPPKDCQSFTVGHHCCEFVCLDDIKSIANTIKISHLYLTFIPLYWFLKM